MNKRRFIALLAPLVLGMLAPPAVAQDSFPSKAIRIVVPYTAGGLTDVSARLLGKELQRKLGQPIVVENKPGANQIIGAEAVARSPADGYTLYFGSLTSLVLNKFAFKTLPYDPVKDFAPVTLAMSSPLYLLVNSDRIPAKTLHEFLTIAHQNPGKYAYASLGPGSSYHVVMEMFKQAAKLDVTHVPYKGSSQGLTALVGGEVQVMFDAGGPSFQFVKDGRLRPLAVSSDKRNPAYPDVPTLTELGFPGFELQVWFGLLAPAGTPKPVVDKLNAALTDIISSPAFKDQAMRSGFSASPSTPEGFASQIANDLKHWAPYFKAANIQAQ